MTPFSENCLSDVLQRLAKDLAKDPRLLICEPITCVQPAFQTTSGALILRNVYDAAVRKQIERKEKGENVNKVNGIIKALSIYKGVIFMGICQQR